MFGKRRQISRLWIVVLLMVSLFFLVTACGGGATPEPSSPTSEPADSTEPVEPSPEPTATAPAAPKPAEDEGQAMPSLNDIDIHRDPGHSIGFGRQIGAGETHRFLFLASPGDTLSVGLSGTSDVLIGIQHTGTGQLLGVARSNEDPLFVTIPENALYHIVIEDAGGEGGEYVAAFEASSKVSFALDPQYFIIGRLPEGGLLYYTFTAPAGATLQGNVIPHPDTPVDLVVTVRELESQQPVFESDASGPGENEPFTFTVPDNESDQLQTFIVSVEDRDRHKGAYIFVVKSDAPIEVAPSD